MIKNELTLKFFSHATVTVAESSRKIVDSRSFPVASPWYSNDFVITIMSFLKVSNFEVYIRTEELNFSGIKVCMVTVPVPSTFSLVTVESQLAGAYRHILSTPVGVIDPTSPTES